MLLWYTISRVNIQTCISKVVNRKIFFIHGFLRVSKYFLVLGEQEIFS